MEEWKATDRLEVVNGRTGQIMVHPFAFWQEAQDHKGLIHMEQCAQALQAPVLILHGVGHGGSVDGRGSHFIVVATWDVCLIGGDHVRVSLEMATHWPRHLVQAWNAQRDWIHLKWPNPSDSLEFLTTKKWVNSRLTHF